MKNSFDNFDRIITSAPVNKTAAIVAYGKGESWEPKKKITQLHWDTPPKCKPVPKGTDDRTGRQVGRLTAVGYYASKSKGGSVWLVRCACGSYETRTGKAIDNPNNTEDCCNKCRALAHARSHYSRASRDDHKTKSIDPLPVKDFTPNGNQAEDLTGKTVGYLTVIGCSPEKAGTSGSKWVVRCQCGMYELRNGKYLRKAIASQVLEGGTMCDDCKTLAGKHIKSAAGVSA